MEENTFEEFEKSSIRRRELLPLWIKIFCWLFMLFGIMSFICLILGFTDIRPDLAFYGFETNIPFSLDGLIVISIGLFKGVTAFSLWFEKDYAIQLGKIDAIIGIVLCVLSMIVLPFFYSKGLNITIRLELLLLVPFLLKLNKIQHKWESTKLTSVNL